VSFLLDTNVAIHLRDGDDDVIRKVSSLDGAVLISVITRVELEGGVYRHPAEAGLRRARLEVLLEALPVLAFDDAAAEAYRAIVEATGYSRQKLLDRMIAAQAIVHGATLVTLTPDAVKDIPGLQVLVWRRRAQAAAEGNAGARVAV
jgi:tRNA(fMet)-specific endonuclease VapC